MVMVMVNALNGVASNDVINDYINYGDDDDDVPDDVDVDDVIMTLMMIITIFIITMAILFYD